MNTTAFMDKQIMDLTSGSSTQSKDFLDLVRPQHEVEEDKQHHQIRNHHHGLLDEEVEEEEEEKARGNGISENDIVPSYDFQPIRPNYGSAPNFAAPFSRPWNSDSNSFKAYGSLDSIEPAKVIVEKDRNTFDATMLSEIDRTVKKHMENMLHVLEGVSVRITQLETRTQNVENSVDDLKVYIGNNHGSTDGKLRQLENMLLEVQSGMQTIKDKQDIVQAQLQLAKLQVSKTDQQQQTQTSVFTDPVPQSVSAPVQSQPQLPPAPANLPQSIPVVPPPNAPPQPPPQQGLPPPPGQHPSQFSHNQIPAAPQRDPYFPPPPVQSQETPSQQYQLPLSQQPQQPPPAAPPHQQYQQTPHPQYSPPAPHLPQQQSSHPPMNPPQLQSSLGHHLEEPPYATAQNYPPNVRQPPSQSPSGPPPPQPQQFYGTPPHGYEPPSSRSGSGYSSGYATLSGPADPYRYGGPAPPQYGGASALKPQQLPTASSVAPSGGNNYPQLPTARVLPQAIPTASAVSGGSGSPGAGGRVPIDDVVDKVASMGFPRDQVRATVRRLTENGQSVDLNAVLDKLMNDGEVQPPRGGWFGR